MDFDLLSKLILQCLRLSYIRTMQFEDNNALLLMAQYHVRMYKLQYAINMYTILTGKLYRITRFTHEHKRLCS